MRVLPRRGQAKQHAALLLSPRPGKEWRGFPAAGRLGRAPQGSLEPWYLPEGLRARQEQGTPRGEQLSSCGARKTMGQLSPRGTQTVPGGLFSFHCRFARNHHDFSSANGKRGRETSAPSSSRGESGREQNPLGLSFLPWPNASLVQGGRTGLQSWTNPAPRLAPAPADPFGQVGGSHKPCWRLTTVP